MDNKLSIKVSAEYYKVWLKFDKSGNGTIPSKELGTLLRSMNMNPTDNQLQDLVNKVNTKFNGTINFRQFLTLITDGVKEEVSEDFTDDIREAFRVFDSEGTGFINAAQLRHIMTNLGEKLTAEEVEEMIREGDTDGDGQINYEDFISLMTK